MASSFGWLEASRTCGDLPHVRISKFPLGYMALMTRTILTIVSSICLAAPLQAATISGGSATFTLRQNNPTIAGLQDFNAYFNDTATYSYITAWDSANYRPVNSGNIAYSTSQINGVDFAVLNDPVRPTGFVPTPVAGRDLQTTTLEFSTQNFSSANFLADWSPSTVDGMGMFATVSGEKIGFSNMTRWTPLNSSGTLINGDFALIYAPGRIGGVNSGLGLVAHAAGFNPFYFADLGNANISFNSASNELNISGDILISGGVTYWDGFATNGSNLGTFNMTALVVPEPSTLGLLASVALISGILIRRRRG